MLSYKICFPVKSHAAQPKQAALLASAALPGHCTLGADAERKLQASHTCTQSCLRMLRQAVQGMQ